MPNFDQTGPNGNGQLTGRGLGNCQGTRQGGFLGGIRRGLRRGAGLRRWCPFWNTNQQPINDKATLEQEIQDTKEYLQSLEEEKKNISKE